MLRGLSFCGSMWFISLILADVELLWLAFSPDLANRSSLHKCPHSMLPVGQIIFLQLPDVGWNWDKNMFLSSGYWVIRTHGWAPPNGLNNTSSSSNIFFLVFQGGLPSRDWPGLILLILSGQPVLCCRVIWLWGNLGMHTLQIQIKYNFTQFKHCTLSVNLFRNRCYRNSLFSCFAINIGRGLPYWQLWWIVFISKKVMVFIFLFNAAQWKQYL